MFKRIYVLLVGIIVQIWILQFLYQAYFEGGVNSLLLYNVYGVGVSNQILYYAYSYFFFGVISFYFIGSMRRNIENYGILQLYRGKSKLIFLSMLVFKMIYRLVIILLLETMAFTFFYWIIDMGLKITINDLVIKSYILWILTFTALIIIQMTLELFMDDTVAVLIINLYVLVSISFGSILLERGSIMLYLFIPNFSMYLRSDVAFHKSPLTFSYEIVILFIIIIVCFIISLRRLKTKDYVG